MSSRKLLISGITCLIIVASFVIAQSIQRTQEHTRDSLAVTILLPSSGDAYKGNDSCTIKYEITGGMPNYTVILFYTSDGVNFSFIDYHNQTSAGIYEYNWPTPPVTSNSVRIRVNITDAENVTTMGLSNTFEIDSTEPSAISDLSAQAKSYNAITLTWTAPGENGLPYNFTDVKDEVPDLDITDNAQTGVTSNLTVTGNIILGSVRIYLHINHTCINQLIVKLINPENTEATLFYMTGGTASNIWGWYEGQSFVNDTESGSPAPVDDISVFRGKNSQGTWKLFISDNSGDYTGVIDSWKIEFTAENVMEYDIRYNSTAPIDSSNWAGSTQCTNEPTPSTPGRQEMFNVTGLDSGIKYYFAIKSNDNVRLNSSISNCASVAALLYVNVISPNGNEIWGGKSTHVIKYEISGFKNPTELYSVNVYYLYDYITQYIGSVNHDVLGTYEFNWTVPELNITNMKIRVNVTTPNSTGFDESDFNFTIDYAAPYAISAPSNAFLLPNEEITIEFSEPMNSTSVEQAFSIFPGVENIYFIWNANSTTVAVYHDDFTYNTLYNCGIDKTAKDISEPGNGIAEFYNFSFTAIEKLSCKVLSPNGNETWDGTAPQVIQYEILGGAPPYNISFYWINATNPTNYTVFIGYESRLNTGTYAFSWSLSSITNNTLEIKIIVADNTTPAQQAVDMSNGTFEIDSTLPGKPQPEALAADSIAKEGYPRAHAVKLNWLASGDDESVGKASYYHVRYATQSVNESNWDDLVVIPSSQRFNYSASAESGAYDSYIISDLQPNTTYYFALKAYDNVGFASQISDCISIKTLKWQRWPDDLEPAEEYLWDAVLKTLFFRADEEVEDTEVWMKGNLKIVNDAKLTFENVMFLMDTSEDFEYSITVAPAVYGYIEGGKFEVLNSNISARISVLEDDTEVWHPYLFVAYERSRFWLMYSSMNHCGGKLEDIENPSVGIGIIQQEIDIEGRGIEVRSSDVSIEDSLVADNWGIFIRTSLVSAASPTIRDNIIRHNRYGVVIKPHVPMDVQWPLNLINNVIDDNRIGVYIDTARVGLEGCRFTRNSYGAIYNNTPSDWPHNVSGVIYHCIFENNIQAIMATDSSLKFIETDVLNNTLNLNQSTVVNQSYATIYCDRSTIDIDGGNIIGNTQLNLVNTTVSNVTYITLYISKSIFNITGTKIENNACTNFENSIVSYVLVTTIYTDIEISAPKIKNIDAAYNIHRTWCNSIIDNFTASVIYCRGSLSVELTDSELEENGKIDMESATIDYLTLYAVTLFAEVSSLNITGCTFENNYDGIFLQVGTINILNSVFTGIIGDDYGGGYAVFTLGSILNITNSNLTGNYVGVLGIYTTPTITNSTINDNAIGIYCGGIPTGGAEVATEFFAFEFAFTVHGLGMFNLSLLNLTQIEMTLKIDDSEMLNKYYGLYLDGASANLNNNTLSGEYYGILALWADIYMKNTSVSTSITYGLGALLIESSITLIESIWSSNLAGLYAYKSDVNIKDTSILYSTINIYADEGSHIEIENVNISGGIVEWFNIGIYTYKSSLDIVNITITDKKYGTTIGGIYSFSSYLNISESKFFDNSKCIYDQSSTITVTSSTFLDNDVGIWCKGSELIATDNIFNNTGVPIKGYCTGTIASNTMIYGDNGLDLSDYSPDILNNTISEFSTGMRFTRSSPLVAGNTITTVLYGIWCADVSSPTITDTNTITNAQIAGINVGYHCAPYIANNTLINASQAIYCEFGSSPNITDNGIFGSEYGIYALGTTSNKVTLSIIGNLIINNTYGIWAGLSAISIKNTLLTANTYGIYATETTGNIESATIMNNYYGIYLHLSSLVITNTLILNNTLASDNSSYGLCLEDCHSPYSSPVLINCTVTNNTMDIFLNRASKIEVINSSFTQIQFYDSDSELTVFFYLEMSVKWQTGAPVENATVTIYNKYSTSVFSALTNKTGTCTARLLINYINATVNRTYQPYTISASIYDLFDNKTLWVNATNSVNVCNTTGDVVQQYVPYVQLYSIQHDATIFDPINPTVSINQIPFSLTNNPQLSISGRASDNIGIWQVQINVNNGSWADTALKVLNSTYGNYTVEWSGILTLQEGSNYIQARAVDTTHNNTATAAAGIVVLDTTAPSIELLSPKYNATNQSSVVIELRIPGEPLENVTLHINEFAEVFQLNETGVAVRNRTVALTEGINAISISVSDKLGNENHMSVIIMTVDQKAPESFIILPVYEYVNSISEVRVSATDDLSGVECVKICIQKGGYYWTGSSWGTAEKWLNATSSAEGYWRYSWHPANDEEYNIFTYATDRAGNPESPHSKKFVYDTTKPLISISVPATTELSNIMLSGRTEIGANVTINQLPVYVDENGNFNVSLELGDGMNNFTIYAEDRAGNTNETVVTIERIVKVQPPQLLSVWMFVAAGIAVAVIATVVLLKKPKKPVRKPEKETTVKDETKEKVAETRYF